MNLQEILKSFELSEEQITQINQAVDKVIESKLVGNSEAIMKLEDELTKTKGDLDTANEELLPVKENAKKEKLAELMPENANPDLHEDIISLAKIEDEDEDEAIKTKLAKTVEGRDYLKKISTEDSAAEKKTETKKPEAEPEEEENQEMPTGVK